MHVNGLLIALICAMALLSTIAEGQSADLRLPYLRREGNTTQLIVDGQPFLMLAGELHNSSASSAEYLARLWPRLTDLHLNTVLAPVSWELVEPREGAFDFSLVDVLLKQARGHGQRLVLLWFGSWKNGASSYAPEWVLTHTKRFPRALGSANHNLKDVLSPLSEVTRKADATAFAHLLHHLKQVDGKENTVVMVQVENEVGIMPEPRDLSPEADRAYAAPVPSALMDYLAKHESTLHPELLRRWRAAGHKPTGSWAEVFGSGPESEEVFSTWCYARYIDYVAAAGKAEYPLPMYVNAWLPGSGKIGTYPTGGPVAHMHDIWRAGAPHIDLLAPDIYGGFVETLTEFTRGGNPLFIPEASSDPEAAARVYWALGRYSALGFSPFGIESLEPDHPLAASYALLRQLLPAIARAQGTNRMVAIYPSASPTAPFEVRVGDYTAHVSYQERLPEGHPPIGGLILQISERELLVAGYGFAVHFDAVGPGAGRTHISHVDLGGFDAAGVWANELRLNGDETGANYQARVPPFLPNHFLGIARPMILKVTLYQSN
jgi:hypothetical protein